MDWLSRLFEMMPVRGRLDLRCSYGAPWRIDQGPGGAAPLPARNRASLNFTISENLGSDERLDLWLGKTAAGGRDEVAPHWPPHAPVTP